MPIGSPIARVGDSAEGSSAQPRVLSPRGRAAPCGRGRGFGPATGAQADAAPRRGHDAGGSKCRDVPSRSGRRAGQSFAGGEAAGEGARASTWRSIQGSGPGGRIVKEDVKKAAAPRVARRRVPRGAEARRRARAAARPAATPVPSRARDRQGPGHLRGPVEAAVDDRAADVGVEGDGAALLPGGRDRHEPGGRGAGAAEGGGRRGRGGALLQRHGRQGLRAGAARAPAGQRRLPRRALRALLAGQRRGRRRRPGRAGRPHRLRRRPARACGRSPPTRGRWPQRVRDGRSPRRSSPAAPSPSPTWGCTGSTTSAP